MCGNFGISLRTVIVLIQISLCQLVLTIDWPATCPEIVSREQWGGKTPIVVEYTLIPVKYIIVHHTVTSGCNSLESCSNIVRSIQNFHMDNLEFHDIGYNFLVGGDGRIYEGAGWHKVGAHTRGFNTRSLGISFIGDFSINRPRECQLKAAQNFLDCAVKVKELDANYTLYGAKQVSVTASPGIYLYNKLKEWPHFGKKIDMVR